MSLSLHQEREASITVLPPKVLLADNASQISQANTQQIRSPELLRPESSPSEGTQRAAGICEAGSDDCDECDGDQCDVCNEGGDLLFCGTPHDAFLCFVLGRALILATDAAACDHGLTSPLVTGLRERVRVWWPLRSAEVLGTVTTALVVGSTQYVHVEYDEGHSGWAAQSGPTLGHVALDGCGAKYHFACAGVDPSCLVEGAVWRCPSCTRARLPDLRDVLEPTVDTPLGSAASRCMQATGLCKLSSPQRGASQSPLSAAARGSAGGCSGPSGCVSSTPEEAIAQPNRNSLLQPSCGGGGSGRVLRLAAVKARRQAERRGPVQRPEEDATACAELMTEHDGSRISVFWPSERRSFEGYHPPTACRRCAHSTRPPAFPSSCAHLRDSRAAVALAVAWRCVSRPHVCLCTTTTATRAGQCGSVSSGWLPRRRQPTVWATPSSAALRRT